MLPETGTPGPDELLKTWSNDPRTNETHPTNRDRCVLQQSLRGVRPDVMHGKFFLVVDVFPMVQRIHNHELPVNDGDKGVEDGRDVASHVVTQLHRYLSSSPGGVVAHADVLRVQVAGQDRHELCGDDNN